MQQQRDRITQSLRKIDRLRRLPLVHEGEAFHRLHEVVHARCGLFDVRCQGSDRASGGNPTHGGVELVPLDGGSERLERVDSRARIDEHRGSVAVDAVEPGDTADSHNLVIAGTHVYFVGQQALLSHDVTLPRSTNRKSPGLAK